MKKQISDTTVVVGMSGGVDSSVAAFLLKEMGYKVIGVFMKNWEDEGCLATYDYEDVLKVCHTLNIPCYTYNFAKEYKEKVFAQFLEEYKSGYTPNPDILCNREIKFNVFLQKAKELGADYLATGHYCQTDENNLLIKGKDPAKDQSYFLYTLTSNILKNVLFPIGSLLKSEVREIARNCKLSTAAKKDSTGICFIGKRKFTPFLSNYLGYNEGNFQTLEGKIMGTHKGIAYYTIGQRKGLEIGGQGEAWFVVGKDAACNIIFVAQGKNHPALFADFLTATDLTWVSSPPVIPKRCRAKIRYRQEDQWCTIQSIEKDVATVIFDTPQRAITPRQSIVFYESTKNICIGGGMIQKAGFSYYEQKKHLPRHNIKENLVDQKSGLDEA